MIDYAHGQPGDTGQEAASLYQYKDWQLPWMNTVFGVYRDEILNKFQRYVRSYCAIAAFARADSIASIKSCSVYCLSSST